MIDNQDFLMVLSRFSIGASELNGSAKNQCLPTKPVIRGPHFSDNEARNDGLEIVSTLTLVPMGFS